MTVCIMVRTLRIAMKLQHTVTLSETTVSLKDTTHARAVLVPDPHQRLPTRVPVVSVFCPLHHLK